MMERVVDSSQILALVQAEIQSLFQGKSGSPNLPPKDKNYQIALFQLKVLRRVFEYVGGDREFQSLVSLQTKAEMLEENILTLSRKDSDLNQCINELRSTNQSQSQQIQKLDKRLEILNKKALVLDKLGGKAGFERIEGINKSLEDENQKLKLKNSQFRQSVTELESKLLIYKKMNTSQEIKIAQLILQVTEFTNLNKGSPSQLNVKEEVEPQQIALAESLPQKEKEKENRQNSFNQITILSLKQQNSQLRRQNDRLKEEMETQASEWGNREKQYARTLKNIRAGSRSERA